MKIAIVSLGCPKNQVDADVMCHALMSDGHTTTASLEEADIIIVNTCGFIESAKQEAIETILDACTYKRDNPALKVVVTGCLAQRYKDEIRKEIPEADAVIGIGSNGAIASIIRRVAEGETLESYGAKTAMPLGGKRVISTPRHYAYLKLSEGCSNCCSYCAIPLIRGPLRSRTLDDVISEAKWLADEGVKELILVAQDLTEYGRDLGDKALIAPLLYELNKLEGIRWIRLLYAYPERVSDEFIAAMAQCDKVVPYLDIPIQHCNSEILKSMNRKGDRDSIISAILRLRTAIPNITLRTTLIAGYPGESEEQFAELCSFVQEYNFERLGCFAYSEEEGTAAAAMPQLPQALRRERADAIMRIQTDIMQARQAQCVDTTFEVICDGADEENGLYILRSAADAPDIDSECYAPLGSPDLQAGDFCLFTATSSDVYDLYGEIQGDAL